MHSFMNVHMQTKAEQLDFPAFCVQFKYYLLSFFFSFSSCPSFWDLVVLLIGFVSTTGHISFSNLFSCPGEIIIHTF